MWGPTESSLPQACPTFAYYFPIIPLYGKSVQPHERPSFLPFSKAHSIYAFSDTNLQELSQHGLFTRAVVDDSRLSSKDWDTRSPSFPWIIVYVEEHGQDALCYSKAVASATVALKMYTMVARYADDQFLPQYVPPVVVFAAVGKEMKAWLAFSYMAEGDAEPSTVRTRLIYLAMANVI